MIRQISVFALKCYNCKDEECQNLGESSDIRDCAAGSGCAWDIENCKLFSLKTSHTNLCFE